MGTAAEGDGVVLVAVRPAEDVAAAAAAAAACAARTGSGSRSRRKRLLPCDGRGELARDLGLLGSEFRLCLASRIALRRLFVGGDLVLCLLLLQRGVFVCNLFVLLLRTSMARLVSPLVTSSYSALAKASRPVSQKQNLIPCRLRIHVDVGRDGLSLESLAVTTHSVLVRGDLILRRSNLGFVVLDLGAVDVVLLLVRTDLQLFEDEILRYVQRLGS